MSKTSGKKLSLRSKVFSDNDKKERVKRHSSIKKENETYNYLSGVREASDQTEYLKLLGKFASADNNLKQELGSDPSSAIALASMYPYSKMIGEFTPDGVRRVLEENLYKEKFKFNAEKFGADNEVIRSVQKALDNINKGVQQQQGGEPEKKKEVKKVRILPPILDVTSKEGSEKYKQLSNVKDRFDAVPDEVIRLSLLKDMLVIEPPTKSAPKIQITSSEFANSAGPVLFYNPFCSHCQNFAPTFAQMVSILKGKCPVGMVDCLDRFAGNDILSKYLDITGYPTVKVYSQGKFIDYTGGNDLKQLLSFVCMATGKCLE